MLKSFWKALYEIRLRYTFGIYFLSKLYDVVYWSLMLQILGVYSIGRLRNRAERLFQRSFTVTCTVCIVQCNRVTQYNGPSGLLKALRKQFLFKDYVLIVVGYQFRVQYMFKKVCLKNTAQRVDASNLLGSTLSLDEANLFSSIFTRMCRCSSAAMRKSENFIPS